MVQSACSIVLLLASFDLALPSECKVSEMGCSGLVLQLLLDTAEVCKLCPQQDLIMTVIAFAES